ncbi:blue copper protein-like isoform X1 [Diospyros lotus]|uniref:blue copper protein-like isoform X1 n=1 Tax=Diospyros lotus TaxID=55363 RepID=UPI0022576D78|nr:blue copper protein-like isoform X1 [Diospyros lotus]
MASFGAGIVNLLMMVVCSAVPSLATVYAVGDLTGWTMGVDYSAWTTGKTFMLGDTLVFNYGSGHTVDEVSRSDYKTCTVGNSITTDNSGSTTIALKTAGTHYYICGVIGHCGSGMKLAVTVAGGAASAAVPPPGNATAAAASTPPTMVVTTPPATVLQSSSAAGTLSRVVPVLVLSVAVFQFALSQL